MRAVLQNVKDGLGGLEKELERVDRRNMKVALYENEDDDDEEGKGEEGNIAGTEKEDVMEDVVVEDQQDEGPQ